MTILAQPMIGRRLLRLAVVGALQRAGLTVNGAAVMQESPGDWSIPEDQLPLITVRTGDETKACESPGQPNFTTTCEVTIRAVVANTTAEAAQDDIEALWYFVENAVLMNYSFIGVSQKIPNVRSKLEIKAEGSRHLAGIVGSFELEYFESFDVTQDPPVLSAWPNDPPPPVPLLEVTVTPDLVNVFDPNGTYPNPPFPAAIDPAPRVSGPDGRAEGFLTFNLEG